MKVKTIIEIFIYFLKYISGYWVNNADLSETETLHNLLIKAGVELTIKDIENPSEQTKETLIKNTQEIVDRGGFGVPSYYLEPYQK